ncbi:MAG: fibronectin type III domain-containing protein [Archangiaceae bacterium]|nr:fibronectin type III domain-containing protein [Archangiaceae bacterium]
MSLALSLVPLLAAGQLGVVTLDINQASEISIGADDCGTSKTGTWTVAFTGYACSSLSLWVTQGDCGDAIATGDLKIADIAQSAINANRSQSSTVSIAIDKLPAFAAAAADGGAVCGSAGVEVDHKFCAAVSVYTDLTCFTKSTVRATTPVTIHYDTKAPGAPSVSAEALDSAAAVTVSYDSDTESLDVQARIQGEEEFVTLGQLASPNTNKTIDGLENGVTYEVQAIAYDSVGNASEASAIATVTPRKSSGFWESCVAAGCNNGGCSTTPAALGLATLAAMLLLRRRVRR